MAVPYPSMSRRVVYSPQTVLARLGVDRSLMISWQAVSALAALISASAGIVAAAAALYVAAHRRGNGNGGNGK